MTGQVCSGLAPIDTRAVHHATAHPRRTESPSHGIGLARLRWFPAAWSPCMSLRLRLFLLLSTVVAGLVLAQWWLAQTLTRELSSDVSQVALSVGESVVTRLAAEPATAAALSDLALREAPQRNVTERVLHVREVDGRLQVIGERVVIGPEDAAPLDPATSASFVLKMESPLNAHFLELSGPSLAERIPIPRGAVGNTIDRFKARSLAGSGLLLIAGLIAAAVVAHRASAPLRDLAGAARVVGEGALGTQVIPRGGGEVQEAVGAFNRMSARLAELDEQARMLRDREHLSELGEVARGLAHGLRNPLNALGLSLEELASDPGIDPGRREALATSARRQIRRIDGAVRSFLTLATSGAAASAERVDVLNLVQDVALEASADARGRVAISVESGSEPAPIVAVAAEIRAVLQALIVNAVEASPDGARVIVRVAALAKPDGSIGARVEIDDDGAGLPASVRERLFTPHLTTKPSGAGMGLYLAQRIVTARHGGTLALEDRVPRGTRAILELDGTRSEVNG